MNDLAEARHVDDLRDAVRSLTIVLQRLELSINRHQQQQLVVLQAIAANTAGLPALVDQLQRRSNGTADHQPQENAE